MSCLTEWLCSNLCSFSNIVSLYVRLTVKFKDLKSGRVHVISGYFPWTDPWWNAVVHVNRQKRAFGFPSYRLRSDSAVASEKIVFLFMRACKVEKQHEDMFADALRSVRIFILN
jgi:hypothetical protein